MKLIFPILIAVILMININSSDASFPQNNKSNNKNTKSMIDIFGGIMKFKQSLIKMMRGGVNGHFDRKLKSFNSFVSKSSSSSGGKVSGHSSGGQSSGGHASSQSAGHSSGGHLSGGHSSGGHASSQSSGHSAGGHASGGHPGYGHESGK